MMMMGLEFMGEVPFKDVFIHALVRDSEGQKMSKTRGNVIDPLKVMEAYGTDAFRFTLVALAAQGRDIKMSEDRIAGYRNFMNKLWNSARFVLMNLPGDMRKVTEFPTLEDRWIRSKMARTVQRVRSAILEYRFNEAAASIYRFLWHEYCDWYIEIAKPSLSGDLGDEEKDRKHETLLLCLETVLKLIHPITPYISEEIWCKLPGDRGSICLEAFPGVDESLLDDDAEASMEWVTSIIRGIRNLRRELHIPPGLFVKVRIRGGRQDLLMRMESVIKRLARLKEVEYLDHQVVVKNEASSVVEDTDIFLPLKGVLDFAKERERIEREIEKVNKEMEGIMVKLRNEAFLSRAPKDLVEKNRERKSELEDKANRLDSNRKLFQE
jgi:valyl-tRNA synthetase